MDGWTEGRVHEMMHERTGRRDKWMKGWTDARTERRMDERMHMVDEQIGRMGGRIGCNGCMLG